MHILTSRLSKTLKEILHWYLSYPDKRSTDFVYDSEKSKSVQALESVFCSTLPISFKNGALHN